MTKFRNFETRPLSLLQKLATRVMTKFSNCEHTQKLRRPGLKILEFGHNSKFLAVLFFHFIKFVKNYSNL